MTIDHIHRFLSLARSQRVLVAGDVMLDAYITGETTRISPEAPVPVVEVTGRRHRVGGASNVAANVSALGSKVALAGVTGSDEPGNRLRKELGQLGIETWDLIEDPRRVTTVKTRITAGGQQIVRFDEEHTDALDGQIHADFIARCETAIENSTACVISDYAKGVITDEFSRRFISAAIRNGKPVVVDPKSRDLARYRGATVITPNLKEASASAGENIRTTADLNHAAPALLANVAPSALLITRGGEGMSLFEPGQNPWPLAAINIEVADVTGAGDTVAAVLAIALGAGFNLREAAGIANLAAGLSVRHIGTWAVQPDELMEALATIHATA